VLEYAHDWRYVLASLAIALMAGFTGLALTHDTSRLPISTRKLLVSMAAVALGGGIWSMHFVAMLGLKLPILFYYDALITLISALVAILMAGVALLILHFRPRTPNSVTLAGVIIGLGIPLMHYIGMSGMELCRPVYSLAGVAGALLASVVLSVAAVRIATGERGARNIMLGTLCFGAAVVTVHFAAMAGTGFEGTGEQLTGGPLFGKQTLALIVTLSAFVLSAAFLLTGITFSSERPAPATDGTIAEWTKPEAQSAAPAPTPTTRPDPTPIRVPHEREGRTFLVDPATISAVRAEGHYTLLHRDGEQLFCPWSISEAEHRLCDQGFLRVHRSYLLNPARVVRFERTKDTGLCFLMNEADLRVPVSRTRLASLRAALHL
jgi:NO-binding membrane sensor protein with MHYT domain